MNLAHIRKAIVAGILAALGALGTTVLNGGTLDRQSVVSALAAGLLAGVATYSVPNASGGMVGQ